jgi:carboxymethylenebutenolidase
MAEMIEINNVPAYLVQPSGECKGGLIVVHEVWGLSDHIKDVAQRFAKQGYLVLAPDLFRDTDIYEKLTPGMAEDLFDPEKRNAVQPKLREITAPIHAPGFAEETIVKLKAIFNYIETQKLTGGRVAMTGFCFGGSYSFSLAIAEPKLKAAVPFYGHSDQDIDELKKIKCPVLAIYGENDERLISALPELEDKMKQAEVDFIPQVYPDCGHAFFNDTNRFAYNQVAAEDAWEKTLHFLESNISP